jgi:biotin transport system substrate-specific component
MTTTAADVRGKHGAGTLADLLLPSMASGIPSLARATLLVVAGAALTALAAQLSFTVPWTPVPYTGQTAAVLLVGTALGVRKGAASMALYVLAGLVGLPVYAGGLHGAEKLFGLTGGYLFGFVLASALVGRLAERGWDRSRVGAAMLMALGNLVIYLIGVPALALVGGLSWSDAVRVGALVFLPWDAAKIAVAALALPLAWRAAGNERQA